MLRVSFQGFRNARYFPLGEICASTISGLPKSSSRSMMGGSPLCALAVAGAATLPGWAMSADTNSNTHKNDGKNFFMAVLLLMRGRAMHLNMADCHGWQPMLSINKGLNSLCCDQKYFSALRHLHNLKNSEPTQERHRLRFCSYFQYWSRSSVCLLASGISWP